MIFGARATHDWQVQWDSRPKGTRVYGLPAVRAAAAHHTCLCKWTTDGVTPEEDRTSLKKVGVSKIGGMPGPREQFERDTADLAPEATEGAGKVFS